MGGTSDELLNKATEIVDLIRRQNWKNGGVLVIDRADAVGAVMQALRAAYAEGVVAGSNHTAQIIDRAFASAMGHAP